MTRPPNHRAVVGTKNKSEDIEEKAKAEIKETLASPSHESIKRELIIGEKRADEGPKDIVEHPDLDKFLS